MKKENKTRKEIEVLYGKIAPLKNRIDDLEEKEILEIQRPRLWKMVGYCLQSTYEPKRYYGKILDLIETKTSGLYFILEICHIDKIGNPHFHLDSISPYLNKEWWDEEIPISGWEKCEEEEYLVFKAKIMSEFGNQKSLRNWIAKHKN